MRSVSLKTVDLARLKSSETFIKIKEEKKKKDQSFVQWFCLNDNMWCTQMLWCRSNRLAMRMTWRFDLSSIRQHEKINHVKVVTAYKKNSEDLICEFIKVKRLNIRRFDKLKTNLIDSDQIEYDKDEVRKVWLLTVSQILQNCSRVQTDFETSEKNDM